MQEMQPHIMAMMRDLEPLFIARKRRQGQKAYPNGSHISLRRLMAYEARPGMDSKVWQRRTRSYKPETAISLLIDLSGSMAGSAAQSALDATVLLAETLDKLNLPFAINGFQDELIPFCTFDEPPCGQARRNIEGMPLEAEGTRPGGRNIYQYNDDAPCVNDAASQLLEQDAKDLFLIVISDGESAGRRSNEQDLVTVLAELETKPNLHVIGIGIGDDAGHVKQYYKHAISNVPVARLAEHLGALIKQIVIDQI